MHRNEILDLQTILDGHLQYCQLMTLFLENRYHYLTEKENKVLHEHNEAVLNSLLKASKMVYDANRAYHKRKHKPFNTKDQ